MLHTFDGPSYAKSEKYMRKCDYNHVFHVFLIFRLVGSIESIHQILHPMSASPRNLSKPIGR